MIDEDMQQRMQLWKDTCFKHEAKLREQAAELKELRELVDRNRVIINALADQLETHQNKTPAR